MRFIVQFKTPNHVKNVVDTNRTANVFNLIKKFMFKSYIFTHASRLLSEFKYGFTSGIVKQTIFYLKDQLKKIEEIFDN
ncbi:hypothetical protein BpHYR1_024624 [Brachionus plicatilis]|uniref:Uncharacterized protein n=1 Tax=Brachionus plicatilis TaxID=10195 RepID=A0A3M7SR82_BRAPC|nr:hypothetical protein BpHYR1_024624 [Brachionus plicatilis]